MKIAIGCDHGGFELKNEIKNHLVERGFAVEGFGTPSFTRLIIPKLPSRWLMPSPTENATGEFLSAEPESVCP